MFYPTPWVEAVDGANKNHVTSLNCWFPTCHNIPGVPVKQVIRLCQRRWRPSIPEP